MIFDLPTPICRFCVTVPLALMNEREPMASAEAPETAIAVKATVAAPIAAARSACVSFIGLALPLGRDKKGPGVIAAPAGRRRSEPRSDRRRFVLRRRRFPRALSCRRGCAAPGGDSRCPHAAPE